MNSERFRPKPDRETLQEELRQFLEPKIPPSVGLDAETDLIDESILDSLLIMDVVAFVEGKYGIRLDDIDLAPRNFRTLVTLADCIAQKCR